MSAATSIQPRKRAVQSEGAQPCDGWMKLSHAAVLQLMMICRGDTEWAVVTYIASQANQRNGGGRIDGWTGILRADAVGELCRRDSDMVNHVLRKLATLGVLEVKTVREAQGAEVVTRQEARKVQWFGFVARLNMEAWQAIAAQVAEEHKAKLAAAAELPDDEDEEDDEDEAAEVHVAPVAVYPGGKPKAMDLSGRIQERWRACDTVEIDFTGSVPVAVGFSIVGRTTRVRILDPEEVALNQATEQVRSLQSKGVASVEPIRYRKAAPRTAGHKNGAVSNDAAQQGEQNQLTEPNRSPHSKGDTDVVRAEDIGIRLAKFGIDFRSREKRLDAVRILAPYWDRLDEFVREVCEARGRVRYMAPALIVKMAVEWVDAMRLREQAGYRGEEAMPTEEDLQRMIERDRAARLQKLAEQRKEEAAFRRSRS